MIRNIILGVVLSVGLLAACKNDNQSAATTDSTTHERASAGTHELAGTGNEEIDQVMKKMMADMNTVKMTGDFDIDFAKMMIPHHQGAVDMAEKYLPKGADDKIRSMAENIINTQNKEISELRTLIDQHKPSDNKNASASGHGAKGHNELMEAMNNMMEKMRTIKLTANRDKDFALMMIPHHQSAIEMAENEISHGKNVQIKQFAQKVIDDQTREIKAFEQWLKDNQ